MDNKKYFRGWKQRSEFEISFEFRQHGWIRLNFQFSGLTIVVNLSAVFDPMPDLLAWLNSLYENADVAFLEIDEEGHYKKLILEKFHPLDEDLYEFRVLGDRSLPHHEYEFRRVVSREFFLRQFLTALDRLAADVDKPWTSAYDLPSTVRSHIGRMGS